MTSFSEICEYCEANPEAYKAGAIFYALKLRDYIIMLQKDVFPSLLAGVVHGNPNVEGIVKEALEQLEDM